MTFCLFAFGACVGVALWLLRELGKP